MHTVTLYEHQKLYADDQGTSARGEPSIRRQVFERLREFDLDRAELETRRGEESSGRTIFDWSRRHYAKARQYVGVLSLGNVAIEILPKIEKSPHGSAPNKAAGTSTDQNPEAESRVQLLQMLRYAGVLKAKSRDIAMLASSRASMSELLFWLFAQRVREELGRGMVRRYEERREELGLIRGRIDLKRYAQATVRRPGKIPCVYERHSVNTPLLRLVRAACELLMRISTATRTKEVLREVLVSLDKVDRVSLSPMLVDAVQFTRRNERFEDIVAFCRMLAEGQRPDARAGDTPTFSLLFDMNRLFEGFLAGFFREEVLRRREFSRLELVEQGRGFDWYLIQRPSKSGLMRLKPDLVFRSRDADRRAVERGGSRIVMDAKWKRPSSSSGRPSGDVLYQMYAYATQFECDTVVVLYPEALDSKANEFRFAQPGGGEEQLEQGPRLLTRYVPLDISLGDQEGRKKLADQLARILSEAEGSRALRNSASEWG